MCENKSGCGGCGGRDVGLMAEAVRQALLPTGTLAVRSGLIPAASQNPLSFDWHVPFAAIAVNVISGSTPASGGAFVTGGNSFAAGAAANAALPNGASLTGFDISTANPGATVSGSVGIINLATPIQNYTLVETAANGAYLTVRFPAPLPASGPGVGPTVQVPAIAGGAAGTINVYGVTPTVAALAAAGLTIAAGPPGPGAPGPGPGVVQLRPNSGGVFNLRGNSLTIYGGTPGDTVIVQAFTKPQDVSWG